MPRDKLSLDEYSSLSSHLGGKIDDIIDDMNLKGNLGGVDYRLNTKGLKAEAHTDDGAFIRTMLGYNKTWNVNAHMPLGGGELDLNINKGDNGKSGSLTWSKRF